MPQKITVFFSIHESEGNCNSDALYEIIKRINPDVIFEELSESNFEKAYSHHSLNTLEIYAIKVFFLSHSAIHIPIDTFERPKNYDEEIDSMYNKLVHIAGENSFKLRNFIDQMKFKVGQHGFPLLNCDSNEVLLERRQELITNALNALDDPKLYELAKLEKEVYDLREDTILDNIYRYSQENDFRQGLMLIGSGHRKSIIKKLSQRSKTEKNQINWELFQF